MKIRIIKELFGGPAHSIKAGTELYGRIVEIDPLCKMFQCTDCEYIGREIPYKFYVEIPEDKTFAELRVIELEQENLQRLEEVKGLQHKVESLTEYSKQKSKEIRILNDEVSKAWIAYGTENEARTLLEATLERAMLDHQSVVLPKEVAEAIDYLRSIGIDNDEILRLSFTTYRMSHCAHRSALGNYAIDYPNKVASALVNSYTVELTLPIAEQLADMIQEWTNEPTFDDEDAACLKLANAIAERTKEFYSK